MLAFLWHKSFSASLFHYCWLAAVLLGVVGVPGFLPAAAGQPVPTLPEPPTQGSEELIEIRTLLGEAQRRPGEADSTFVRRVLPVSFAESKDLLAATWRPSAHGKQLFFSLPSTDYNEQGTDLVLLDPFAEDTYAVHVFTIPALTHFIIGSQGEATTLRAIFFADVN